MRKLLLPMILIIIIQTFFICFLYKDRARVAYYWQDLYSRAQIQGIRNAREGSVIELWDTVTVNAPLQISGSGKSIILPPYGKFAVSVLSPDARLSDFDFYESPQVYYHIKLRKLFSYWLPITWKTYTKKAGILTKANGK